MCFNLQQAAEKAIKALVIKHGVTFPYVHDIGELLILLEDVGQSVPEMISQSARLTRFAVFIRYPGLAPPIGHEEYREALELAEAVFGLHINKTAHPCTDGENLVAMVCGYGPI